MVTLWQKVVRPEFFFRPMQLLRYIGRRYLHGHNGFETVRLPWGMDLRLEPDEAVGNIVWRWGLHELFVCEAIWRLLDAGEHALDIGANIGQMTSIMARRAGSAGKVSAFEANPHVYAKLLANIDLWGSVPDLAPIATYQVGASNRHGTGLLEFPTGFTAVASLSLDLEQLIPQEVTFSKTIESHEVPLVRLCDMFDDEADIALVKLDVEGHEAAVLEGAARLLDRGRIRDIILEEHRPFPSSATDYLAARGYTLFSLGKTFWGPWCSAVDMKRAPAWCEVPNYLATLAPARAVARLKGRGWSVLNGRP